MVYRRLMVRIAEEIARRNGALALATGESLGQVASQTLENIARIDEAASVPILRPLIGMDKLEITEQAKQLGTFEISIEPDADCCTLFTPKHPFTRMQAGRGPRPPSPAWTSSGWWPPGVEGATVEAFEFPAPSSAPGRRGRPERAQPQHVAVLTWAATIGMVSTWSGDWPMWIPRSPRSSARRPSASIAISS